MTGVYMKSIEGSRSLELIMKDHWKFAMQPILPRYTDHSTDFRFMIIFTEACFTESTLEAMC